jgi:hypothetical protein
MNVVARILFWLSLVVLTIALVAPFANGARWANAEPFVYAGIAGVLSFGVASIATTSRGKDASTLDGAVKRRRTGTVYCALAFAVMTGVGGIGEYEAQHGWRHEPSSSYGDREMARDPMVERLELAWAEDAAQGTWVCLYTMLAGGAAFVGMIVFAAKKPPVPQVAWGQQQWAQPAWNQQTWPQHPSMQPGAHPSNAPQPHAWNQQGWNNPGWNQQA